MPGVGLEFLLPRYALTDEAYQDALAPADPAAGQSFKRKTPGETVDIYMSVRAFLTCSAAAANRLPRFNILDSSANIVATLSSAVAVTASQSSSFRGHINLASPWDVLDGTRRDIFLPLFFIAVYPGMTFEITATNLQAGDTITNVGLIMQRYWTGRTLTPPPQGVLNIAPMATATLGATAPAPSPAAPAPAPSSSQLASSAAAAVGASQPSQDIGAASSQGGPVKRL